MNEAQVRLQVALYPRLEAALRKLDVLLRHRLLSISRKVDPRTVGREMPAKAGRLSFRGRSVQGREALGPPIAEAREA